MGISDCGQEKQTVVDWLLFSILHFLCHVTLQCSKQNIYLTLQILGLVVWHGSALRRSLGVTTALRGSTSFHLFLWSVLGPCWLKENEKTHGAELNPAHSGPILAKPTQSWLTHRSLCENRNLTVLSPEITEVARYKEKTVLHSEAQTFTIF